jgi:predicted helicase
MLKDILKDLQVNSLREKGDYFEEATIVFLKNDNGYKNELVKVEKYYSWAKSKGLSANDTGIDLVATDFVGEYWAIQCKNFESSFVDKSDIDSFITSSGIVSPTDGKNIFSRRLIFTSSEWSKNATIALENQDPPVTRIDISRLDDSNIFWPDYFSSTKSETSKPVKTPREHQSIAISSVLNSFYDSINPVSKGKLIMACGTGKTFTSSQIVKEILDNKVTDGGSVLYLVPSIALLSQTITEYINALDKLEIDYYAICSDPKTGKNELEDIHTYDLSIPATTNIDKLSKHIKNSKIKNRIIFSTYQSLEIVNQLQKNVIIKDFDLVICDEAHRTAGKTDKEFSRINEENYIKYKKILYMTATPKLFKEKDMKDDSIELYSMDDKSIFGDELYKLGFGTAVKKGLLTDYKVLILGIDNEIGLKFNSQEIPLDDVTKIYGCINTLMKINDAEKYGTDQEPMRSAIAFTNTIENSRKVTNYFSSVYEEYSGNTENNIVLDNKVASDHVDGSMNMYDRTRKVKWLNNDDGRGEIRILSNAKCLSEGVDVPSLDAVIFMNPKNSEVDIVQSIGRVMRKHEGKQYGYVIIPIAVEKNKKGEFILDNSEKYKIVWRVLQALRAHDENFEIVIEKIRNNVEQEKINVIGIEDVRPDSENKIASFDAEFVEKIYGKIVDKVGNSKYLEQWAENVGEIAKKVFLKLDNHITNGDEEIKKKFEDFVSELKENLNSSITSIEAKKMLSQHTITKPIFEALFNDFEFLKLNPVSVAMENMLDFIKRSDVLYETSDLEEFYDSIKIRVQGLGYDNTGSKNRQTVLKELYEKFFRLAFKDTSEDLGIVYTPNEIVDFIIHSADFGLKKYFNKSIKSENVKILDPFTGTGTFIVNLLNSDVFNGDIDAVIRKYNDELFAYEIVLLAYYIANINIEETYHRLVEGNENKYKQFTGIALTDTFNLYEENGPRRLLLDGFSENSRRASEINNKEIKVIIGNPPYSVGDKQNSNDIQKIRYKNLDKKIKDTYVKEASNNATKSLYDSYIRSFRWATDKIGKEGIVCFVTNGAWLDSNSGEGLRKSLVKEYDYIYIFNLRGNQRTKGEVSRKEGGKVFGGGSRTPISIVMLIKLETNVNKLGKIFYHDIGDYLDRNSKLEIVKKFKSFEGIENLIEIKQDENGDWINKRNNEYKKFISLGNKKIKNSNTDSIFINFSSGNKTNRDVWVYNFSKIELEKNINKFLNYYNNCVEKKQIKYDNQCIKWEDKLKNTFKKNVLIKYDEAKIVKSLYRPFIYKYYYNDKMLTNSPSSINFSDEDNLAIIVNTRRTNSFTCFITNITTDLEVAGASLNFPLYQNPTNNLEPSLFENGQDGKIFNISSDFIIKAKERYGKKTTPIEIFNYVYGLLWHENYINKYKNDLQKDIPRIPFIKDFDKLSKLGKELADVHLNFTNNTVDYLQNIFINDCDLKQMRMSNLDNILKIEHTDGTTTKIENLPKDVNDFKVNGRSPLQWAVECYKKYIDSETGIMVDPNSMINDMGGLKKVINDLIHASVESKSIISKISSVKLD